MLNETDFRPSMTQKHRMGPNRFKKHNVNKPISNQISCGQNLMRKSTKGINELK